MGEPAAFSVSGLQVGLFGREQERATLMDQWGECVRGGQALVEIVGEAGVGKTALVRGLSDVVFSSGGRLLELRSNLDASSSHLRLLALLRAACAVRHLSDGEAPGGSSRALMLDGDGESAPLKGAAHRARAFAEVAPFIASRLAATGPLLLLVDDCWRLDLPSVELLEALLDGPPMPLLIIACRRPHEQTVRGDAAALGRFLERASCGVELFGLRPETVEAWFAESFGRTGPGGNAARRCCAETEGNPLHLRALVEGLVRSGELAHDKVSDRWSLRERPAAPTRAMVDLLVEQVESLPARCLEALRWAAASGLTFDAAVLGHEDDADAAGSLDEAVAAGLVSCSAALEPPWRFDHERVRDAVLLTMSAAESARRRVALGQAALRAGAGATAAVHLSASLGSVTDAQLAPAIEAIANHARALVAAADWEGAARLLSPVEAEASRLPPDADLDAGTLAELIARTSWLVGDMEAAIRVARGGLAGRGTENVRLRSIEVRALVAQERFEEAVGIGIRCVEAHGITIPARPSKPRVLWVVLRMRSSLARAASRDLLDRRMTSPEALVATEVLAVIAPAVTAANPELAAVCAASSVALTVEHGVGPDSVFGLAGASLLCRDVLGDWSASRRFGALLAPVAEACGSEAARIRGAFLHEFFHRPFFGRLADGTIPLRRLADQGAAIGELEFGAYSHAIALFHDLVLGGNASTLAEETRQGWRRLLGAGMRSAAMWFASTAWAINELAGKREEALELAGREHDKLPESAAWNWELLRMLVHAARGELDSAAVEAVAGLRRTVDGGTGRLLFDAWAPILGHPGPGGPAPPRQRARMHRLRSLARENPAEHTHRWLVAQAGGALRAGRPRAARDFLLGAAQAAEDCGARLELLLAHRLLAKHETGSGSRAVARLHHEEAERLFRELGYRPAGEAGPPPDGAAGPPESDAVADRIRVALTRIVDGVDIGRALLFLAEPDGVFLRGDSLEEGADAHALRLPVRACTQLLDPELVLRTIRGRERVTGTSGPAAGCVPVIVEPLIRESRAVGALVVLPSAGTVEPSLARLAIVRDRAAQLAADVANAQLAARALQLLQAYSRFVPDEMLRLIGKADITELRAGDRVEREITVMFADVRGFTGRSERLGPGRSFEFVHELFSELEPAIRRHGGVVDKFMGDGILALFPHGAQSALDAAIELVQTARERTYEGGEVRLGIGLNHGPVVLGAVGSQRRLDGTVLADTVNLASRIEALTKSLGAPVLLSRAVRDRCDHAGRFEFRRLPVTPIRGRTQDESLFELISAEHPDVASAKMQGCVAFSHAVLYWERDGPAAAAPLLRDLVARSPLDSTARELLFLAVEAE